MSHDAVLDCFWLAPGACEGPPPSTSAVEGAGSGAGGATSGALKVVILRAGAGAVAGAAPACLGAASESSPLGGTAGVEAPQPMRWHRCRRGGEDGCRG